MNSVTLNLQLINHTVIDCHTIGPKKPQPPGLVSCRIDSGWSDLLGQGDINKLDTAIAW